MDYNFLNGPLRWQMSTFIKVEIQDFSLALTVFEILVYQMFDIESLGQGHRVQHSVANTKPL